jgi:hypothetical protein
MWTSQRRTPTPTRLTERAGRRAKSRTARLLCLLVLLAPGCGWVPADEQAIRTFFAESSLYDRTRLANVAQVAFDPRVEGVVTRFEIVSRTDTSLDVGRVRRVARVDAVVRSRGALSRRTIVVTLEQATAGTWMVTGYQ